MKKTLVILFMLLITLMIFYGAISAMVNSGQSLPAALIIFMLVVIGGGIMVWFFKPDSEN